MQYVHTYIHDGCIDIPSVDSISDSNDQPCFLGNFTPLLVSIPGAALSVGKVAGKILHLSHWRRGAQELIDWDKIAGSTLQMEAHCSIDSTGWFSMGYSPLCKPQLDTHTWPSTRVRKHIEDQTFVRSIFQIKLFLYYYGERYPDTICRDTSCRYGRGRPTTSFLFFDSNHFDTNNLRTISLCCIFICRLSVGKKNIMVINHLY